MAIPSAINPAAEKAARELARYLDNKMPPGFGFTLILWQKYGYETTYISNGNRQDCIKAMREMCDQLEQEETDG